MNTISIKYCDIPTWLYAGDFYRNLNTDDPQEFIEIPADCYVKDNVLTVDNSLDDLRRMVKITLFWILDEIPVGILQFCSLVDNVVWRDAIWSVAGAVESKIFEPLCGVYPIREKVTFQSIIATGKWDLIVHAAEFPKYKAVATVAAAQVGALTLLKYLHEKAFPWDEKTCRIASAKGHLTCLQYAHENGCSWDSKVHTEAAWSGHLHIIQYAHEQGLKWHEDACTGAAMNGCLACLQYLHENGCLWSSEAVRDAAQCGHLACLQYLLEQGCSIHEEACNLACKHGRLHCLQLLHEHNAPWNKATCAHAAQSFNGACLEYLHENGCPWDEETPHQAVRARQFDSLRYALDYDCPYNDSLMAAVVKSGNIECLQYLVEDRLMCMNEAALASAFLNGNFACLQYLIDQGCPPHLNTEFANIKFEELDYYKSFIDSDPALMKCVQYAGERGLTVNSAFCKYVSYKDDTCLEYVVNEVLGNGKKNQYWMAEWGVEENNVYVHKRDELVAEYLSSEESYEAKSRQWGQMWKGKENEDECTNKEDERGLEEVEVETVLLETPHIQQTSSVEPVKSIKIEYVHIVLACTALIMIGFQYLRG